MALALGAVLFLFASFAYAGPSWLALLYHLLVDGTFLAGWLLAAAGLGSVLLPVFRRGDGTTDFSALESVTVTALGLGVLSLVVLGLGLAGWLNRPVALALVAVGLGLGLYRLAFSGPRRDWKLVERRARDWLAAPADWAWLWLAVVPLLSIAAVGAVFPPGALWRPGEPHGYDVVAYHLQVPREWYEAGRVVPLRHNVFSFFPFNVEVQYLLAMHLRGGPWEGMYLAQLMHAAYVVLSVLAVHGCARRFAPGGAGAVVASVAAASVPWLALLAPVAFNEGGLLLYGTLAIGHALRGAASPGLSARSFALAGAMAGFACGAKLTAVPMVLLAVPVALAVETLASRREELKRVAAGAAVFVGVGLLTFSPWLGRTAAWAGGNPVFPEAARLLGRAHFTPAQVERWERAHAAPAAQKPLPARLEAFWRQVWGDWRFGYALLPAALAAGVVAAARRAVPWSLLSLLLMLAAFWLALTHLQGRFFVLAIPIAALLIARVDWGRWTVAGAAGAVLVSLVGWAFVHREFVSRMYGDPPWVQALGAPGEGFIGLHPPEVESMPAGATLTLVGDAEAFWHPRPMSKLRYRTVFDVDTTAAPGILDAWRGGAPAGPDEWQLVDPEELVRFSKTYWQIPPPPPDVAARRQPYVIPPRRNSN